MMERKKKEEKEKKIIKEGKEAKWQKGKLKWGKKAK